MDNRFIHAARRCSIGVLLAVLCCSCGNRAAPAAGDGMIQPDRDNVPQQQLCPQSAREIGSLAGLEGDLFVRGKRVYVAHSSQSISIVDVSDRTRPRMVGAASVSVVNWLHGVHVWGQHAFTGNDGHGLRVIDISDETRPKEVVYSGAQFQSNHLNVFDVSGADGRVFYAEFGGRLAAVDFRDPTKPRTVFNTTLPFRPAALITAGKRLYAGGRASILNPKHSSGVSVFDIGDPDTPRLIGHHKIKDTEGLLAAAAAHVYVARSGQVAAFDSAMRATGAFTTKGSINNLAADEDYLFILDDARGLVIVHNQGGQLREVHVVSLASSSMMTALAVDLPYIYTCGSLGGTLGKPQPASGLHIISLECL